MDNTNGRLKPFPQDRANILSKLFFVWILPLFRIGYRKKDLDFSDLYSVSVYDQSDELRDELRREWYKELKKRKPSLALALVRAFGYRYIVSTIVIGGYEQLILKIAQPFLLGAILDYFGGIAYTEGNDIYYIATAFCLCSMVYLISHHAWLLYILRIGMKARVAVQSLLMEKTFSLSKSALYNNEVGNIINLLSNDVTKFDELCMYAHAVITAPCEALVISVILFNSLGYPYIIGLVLLLAFVPLQAVIGKGFGAVRQSTAKWTDSRIRTMNEIITGMKVIKLYAWEKPFADMVAKIRRSEVMQIRKSCALRAINFTLMFVTSRIILFAVFITFVLTGHQLTAKNVFVTQAFFNTLRLSLTNLFPQGVSNLSETLVSCRRLTAFLLLEEKKTLDQTVGSPQITPKSDKKYLSIKNLVATWNAKDEEPILNKVNLEVKSGELALVIGQVGTGKSSLLLALMKEIVVKSGSIDINGRLSYASQESWTWNSSIRDNITFGQEFDDQRYRKVLEVTALQRDVEILPYGDKTLVGERGVGLSGGQRARVNLARAVYRDADIYLFDDPLSAVDAKVAATIFQKCFKEFLKDKVIILVTHQIQFLRKANKVLLLSEDKPKFYDNVADFEEGPMEVGLALTRSQSISSKVTPERKKLERSDSTLSTVSSDLGESFEESIVLDAPQIDEEQKSKGGVKAWVYWAYIRAGANIFVILICIFLNVASQVLFNATDLWLSVWTNEVTASQSGLISYSLTNETSSVHNFNSTIEPETVGTSNIAYNSIIYSVLIGLLLISTLARSLLFFYMCNQSSINLHNSIFFRVLRSPMSLFESQPIGRILNRFSRDLGILDELLPLNAYNLAMTSFQVIGIFALVSYVSWYLVFPGLALLILALIWRSIYIPSGQAIKRIEAITRSPVYSHISTTIDGLPTIRAFGNEEMFREQFRVILNKHSATWCLFLCASRTLGLYIDWTCVLYVIATTFVLLAVSSLVPAGNAGMALSNAVGLMGLMQYFIRQSTEFESQMTSVERIVEYTKLELEAELETEKRPPPEWPTKGLIRFRSLTLKYPSAPKPTLENISITIEPGEKIGVVGRTGAGKSSLLSCLFRIVEFSGALEIDGINIQTIGLHDLRKKVSIIPQEPVLFAGTVRTNLDPFDEHEDQKIWEALEDVQLKETILELNNHLDHEIREGGSNFSVGQRQLICLGRALLRNNKILVIDEATANVDHKTDSLIQHTIRTKFSHCTVLTIAHRLNTIIDSTRVLVLDAGRVEEFDIPFHLLQRKSSIFSQLVAQTGKSMSAKLHKMAADACPKNTLIMSEYQEDVATDTHEEA